jgi:N-acetylglucosamine-6-sulfatase
VTRGFLLALLAACASAPAPGPRASEPADSGARPLEAAPHPTTPPSFVVVLVDDLRADMLGFAGHPFVETPAIDGLASAGAVFRNAFVTTSLCCPSRGTLLTGLLPQRHGVTTNLGVDLAPDVPTFPKLLQAAGWSTAFVGKWHMGNDASPRPGFDHWVGFEGQGRYYDPVLDVNGVEREVEGYVTDVLTDAAVEWLEAREEGERFCLFLSHKATHAPMAPARRHIDRYADRTIPVPASARDDLAGVPALVRRGIHFGQTTRDTELNANEPVPDRLPVGEWEYAPYVQAYLETTLAVDESVGRVLDALERTGARDDTVVVFTGDNGYLFGEHQSLDKRLAWEESIRVPLIVAAPGRVEPGTVIDELVLNADAAPTILELAGVEAPPMQGRSFGPLLRREEIAWRQHFLYSYFREARLEGLPTTLAVRSHEWKYVVYPDALPPNEELYRLATDPSELENLAADPEHAETLAGMRALLAAEEEATGFALPPGLGPPRFAPGDEGELAIDLDFDAGLPAGMGGGDPIFVEVDGRTGLVFGRRGPNLTLPVDFLGGRSFTLALDVYGEEPDGTILRAGHGKNGLSLELVEGRPVFQLVSGMRRRRVGAPDSVLGRWVRVEAGLDAGGRVFLSLDGGAPVLHPLLVDAPRRMSEPLFLDSRASMLIARLGLTWSGEQVGRKR